MEVISMRIQHNIMALNSSRQLGVNNSAVAKSLEKLSSGYRINRAGDDAAGLAISEKMRAQIKGLTAASDNSQDAISLVQTAEGGLQEVHSMLNRMQELATKSSNGTYTDDVDRKALQDEVDALMTLLRNYMKTCVKTAKKNHMRVRVIGDKSGLAEDIQASIAKHREET